jgi:hypothetical protein
MEPHVGDADSTAGSQGAGQVGGGVALSARVQKTHSHTPTGVVARGARGGAVRHPGVPPGALPDWAWRSSGSLVSRPSPIQILVMVGVQPSLGVTDGTRGHGGVAVRPTFVTGSPGDSDPGVLGRSRRLVESVVLGQLRRVPTRAVGRDPFVVWLPSRSPTMCESCRPPARRPRRLCAPPPSIGGRRYGAPGKGRTGAAVRDWLSDRHLRVIARSGTGDATGSPVGPSGPLSCWARDTAPMACAAETARDEREVIGCKRGAHPRTAGMCRLSCRG